MLVVAIKKSFASSNKQFQRNHDWISSEDITAYNIFYNYF